MRFRVERNTCGTLNNKKCGCSKIKSRFKNPFPPQIILLIQFTIIFDLRVGVFFAYGKHLYIFSMKMKINITCL